MYDSRLLNCPDHHFPDWGMCDHYHMHEDYCHGVLHKSAFMNGRLNMPTHTAKNIRAPLFQVAMMFFFFYVNGATCVQHVCH